jgi:hypothetical protein
MEKRKRDPHVQRSSARSYYQRNKVAINAYTKARALAIKNKQKPPTYAEIRELLGLEVHVPRRIGNEKWQELEREEMEWERKKEKR